MTIKLKPIIKWVGGKTQIIDNVFSYFPKTIKDYYEPFIGGGSVFLKLIEKIENNDIKLTGNINLFDKNEKLINLYNTIKNKHTNLLEKLTELKENYQSAKKVEHIKRIKFIITDEEKENTDKKYFIKKDDIKNIVKQGKTVLYYYYRHLFNTTSNNILSAALFIFLNKTCFRGVYRIGPNGFNVPYGNNNNVTIFNDEQIINMSKLFNKYNVTFECKSFDEIDISNVDKNDYFYFDPPYYPLDKKSFTAYQKDVFGDYYNEKLIELCNNLSNKNVKFAHSNSNAEYINEKYKNFHINKILCKRAINSKKPGSKVMEVIIYN
jgi:DNA adenine methylase